MERDKRHVPGSPLSQTLFKLPGSDTTILWSGSAGVCAKERHTFFLSGDAVRSSKLLLHPRKTVVFVYMTISNHVSL